jgi:PAS domain S-box-containing protein
LIQGRFGKTFGSGNKMFDILVVDDEEGILEATKDYLDLTGTFRIDTATSAKEGLRLISRKQYDVIVSDYQMSEMNGIEFLKTLRNAGDRVPFILFTGHSHKEVALEALNCGANFLVIKGGDGNDSSMAELMMAVKAMTERRMEEIALRRSLERFKRIYGDLPVGIEIFDKDGVLSDLNDAAMAILGTSDPNQIKGLNIFRDMELSDEAKRRIRRGESIIHSSTIDLDVLKSEHGVQSEKSGLIYVERMITPLAGPGPSTDGFFMQIREITEKKHEEAQLQYQAYLMENVHDAIIATDSDHAINSWNAAAERLYGWRSEEVLGKSAREVLRTRRPKESTEETFSNLESAGSMVGEVLQTRKDGMEIDMDMTVIALKNRHARVTGYVGVFRDIAERVKARNDRERSFSLLKATLESTADGILVTDIDGRMTAHNDKFLEMWDIPSEMVTEWKGLDMLGMAVRQVRDPVGFTAVMDRLKQQNNHISNDDVELLDGRIFERYSRPQKLGEKVVGRVWSFRDVTKRRRAEERLRDSEEMLRSILTYSPDAINLIDMDGTIVECNPKALELTGLTCKDEIIGHNMLEAISPDERECMMENIKELIAAGNANRFEYTLVKTNGQPYFAEVTSWAVKDKMGEPALLVSMTKDITDRKKAEEELKKSQDRLLAAQRIAHFGYWEYDLFCDKLYMSDEVFEILGYSPQSFEATLTKFIQHVHPEERALVQGVFQESANNIREIDAEFRALKADGTEIWLYDRSKPVLDTYGRPKMLIGTLQDTTERKNIESKIQLSNRKLNLLGAVTRHDVLNMLTVLMGNVELASTIATDDRTKKYLTRSKEAALVIQKQMEYTRSYEALGTKGSDWINVSKVLRFNMPHLNLNGTRVNMEIGDLELFADKMLDKALSNLMENAVRHGEKVKNINIRFQEDGCDLKLFVEDDGIGIAEEEKEMIFRRGYGKHTGLGLNLTREILGITGMSIKEVGLPGEGARFEICVPSGKYRIHGAEMSESPTELMERSGRSSGF